MAELREGLEELRGEMDLGAGAQEIGKATAQEGMRACKEK
jgi:hypothetical protein